MKRNNPKTVAVVFGVLALAAVAAAQAQDAKPFIGAWRGTLRIGGQEAELFLTFTRDEAGKIQGTFDFDANTHGALGLRLENIEIKDKIITFLVNDPTAPTLPAYKGSLDETGQKLSGEFTQGGFAGTFAVEKQ